MSCFDQGIPCCDVYTFFYYKITADCHAAVLNNTAVIVFNTRHIFYKEIAIYPTGGVLLYLPHHLDLASEDSVGHRTCMSVLARRRAIIGSIVQPKRSCQGLSRCCHVLVTVHAGASQGYVLGIALYPTGRSST